jgi:hypothetical protein
MEKDVCIIGSELIITSHRLESGTPNFSSHQSSVSSIRYGTTNTHANLWRDVGTDLVPVGEGLGGSGGEPDGGVRPDEGHVEPEGQPVNSP